MERDSIDSRLAKNIKANSFIYIFGFVLLIFLFVIAVLKISSDNQNEVNWLSQNNWNNFTGAQETNNGIKFTHTGRVINHSDTSTAQPNPPVNIRGSYLKVPDDFQIQMNVSEINNEAIVQFYGQIPVIYDEWRQEGPSIRLNITSSELYVRVWNGTAANSIDERKFKKDSGNESNLIIVHKDGNFTFTVNGKSLGTIPNHNIFSGGKVWFGADAKLDTEGWLLKSLSAKSIGNQRVEVVDSLSTNGNKDDPYALQNLSNNNPRKLPIGVAVSIGPLFSDEKYNKIALSQFGIMTPENSFKPQFIHPLSNLYLFKDTDILVETALQNNMTVHGHALVMYKANPEWMQKTPEIERKQVMIDHINTVVGRYKGRIAQWDVVNEPMSQDDIDYDSVQNGIRKHMWFDAMGEEYIDIAFKAARAADPSAKLYLNDYGIEKDGKRWDALLSLVKRLQARGVPIDGIGFESHVYHTPADTIDPIVLKQHIQILASMGLVSRISEIDVLGDDPAFQAKQYADILQVCLSEVSCTSYGVWGITDLYGSTTLSDRYPIVRGDSLLWDKNYNAKEAFKSLQTALD